ncbi:MAG: hypothetical protein QM652_10780 [Legionella sp.]|uniref:hypothetical protein n=1 Tax=Legionella sp. TaxID=459 RepID=UPI0039E6CB92
MSEQQNNLAINQQDKFTRRIVHNAALASNNVSSEKFDLENAKSKCAQGLSALDVQGGLQSMLAAQMLSIHQLQQTSMIYANATDNMESKQYYTNTAIKLANCFVQQANVLARLQGMGQKITVERVDVHNGGKAVVGNIRMGGVGDARKI